MEVLKGNLETGELALDEYMGQIGSLAFMVGKSTFNQNYSEVDFQSQIEDSGEAGVSGKTIKKSKKINKEVSNDVDSVPKKRRNPELLPGLKGRKPQMKQKNKHVRAPAAMPASVLSEEPAFEEISFTDSLMNHIKQRKLQVQLTKEVTP